MIKTAVFQKYFLLALACLLGFVIFGIFFNGFLMRTLMSKPSEFTSTPPLFIARLIDRLNEKDKVAAAKELVALHSEFHPSNLVLIDGNGNVLYPAGFSLNFEWNKSKKPELTYQFTVVENDLQLNDEPSGPPPPMGGALGGPLGGFGLPPPGPPPGGRGGPHPGMKSYLIRLSGEVPIYLYLMPPKPSDMPQPGGFKHGGGIPFPLMGFLSLFVSLILGVGAAISLIYFSVNKKVSQADDVISQLQSGNLKARFVIKRKDEFGQAMMRFNTMADEIEKLVEHLRAIESSRTKLLQELAHDLRTPIASLKSLLETLTYKSERIDATTKAELMSLSLQEVSYFERLVEDLLFLSQVAEPRFQNDKKVSLTAVLKDEADKISLRYRHEERHQENKINFSIAVGEEECLLAVDENILRRLFRNALENAASFAKSEVRVSVNVVASQNPQSQFLVTIEDDGPGFSPEILTHFGERRVSRKLEKDRNNRISVGLGSVVMKTICNSIKASLKASNRTGIGDQPGGARVEIELGGG